MSKDSPVMAQYRAIKAQHHDCLLFFRLGDFYELFEEDARIASQALDIVLTCRGKESEVPIPMCGVPAHASENYIARLIKKGFRVAICEQMETPSAKQGKGPVRREVTRIVTPGTLTEESLLEAKAHNFLAALFPQGHSLVAMATADISTGDFFIESCSFSSLMCALERLNPSEIIAPQCILDIPAFAPCWSEWKGKIHTLPSSRFDQGEKRIADFFSVQTVQSFGSFSHEELAAAGGLLDYLILTQKKESLILSRPKKFQKNEFLEMDAFTRRNLELVKTFSGEKRGSLLSVLDHTITAIGGRLLAFRLAHPVTTKEIIHQRLDSVQFFMDHPHIRQSLREILSATGDLERALSRLLVGRGTPRDLGCLKSTLSLLPQIHALFNGPDVSTIPTELAESKSALIGHPPLNTLLHRAIGNACPPLFRDGGIIAPGYNKQLDEVRHLRDHGKTLIQTLQEKYAQETQIATLRIRHNHIIGYFIEVPPSAASKVPFHFILRQSLISGHRYTTSELIDLEQQLASAEEEARQIELHLLEEIIDNIREATPLLKASIAAIGVCDVSSALAHIAQEFGYIRPTIDNSLTFTIKGGRHPVIEHMAHTEGKNLFTKNDCVFQRPISLWILTGPNMAGKSTFLRQNALIALMAHIGSFVPADSAHIGLIDRLFSRVGASDDLARGHSTFMIEMLETATILNQATVHSFVILDEVGRGTSTYDGLSLAWACAEYVAQNLRCRTLFATHYHELAHLKGVPEVDFYTLKIKEWNREIIFLHKVIPGVADRSYGLHVARMAGIPEAVLHRAENLLSILEKQSLASPLAKPPTLFPM
jgi:DNA mismatch repair protein MutS